MHRLLAIALSSTLVLQVAPLMAAPGASAVRAAGIQAPAATGIINGTARSAAGQTLPNCRVQVRDLQTGKLAGTGTSNAEGAFSFAGLPPASYVVEVVRQTGEIVGSNAAMPVVAGGTIKMAVSATAAGDGGRGVRRHQHDGGGGDEGGSRGRYCGMAAPAGRDHASPSR